MQLPKGGQRLAAVAEHVDEYLYWLWPDELEKDENGKYIIKDPEMVTQIYKEKKNGK